MKKINLIKFVIPFLHILFWMLSFIFWNAILNPGVSSAGVVGDIDADWDIILPLNLILLLHLSLPFIWFARKARLWIKIPLTIIFMVPFGYVIWQAASSNGNKDEVEIFVDYYFRNFMYVIVFHLTIIAAVYLHLNVLIRRFLNQSRFKQYVVSLAGLIAGAAILNFAGYNYFIDKLFPNLYYISYFRVWELVLIVCAYLIVTSILFLIWQYVQMLIEKRDTARNELSALKAQINPHFLFNNLNTIYSLATQKDERTSDVILKLSDFLRYILYDTSAETIPIEKEIEIIKTYIGLQQERINPEITSVEFETEGDFTKAQIAPLLLLPLVENCFKHGIGKDQGTIRIFIGFNDKQLCFQTENNIAIRENAEENGGIGIKNVEKRLNLIYPGCHSLVYGEKAGIFRLELKIELITKK